MGKGEHLGELEQVVLLAIARLGEVAHGAAIHREIQSTTGRDLSIATVYVTVQRLEAKGYVKSRPDAGGVHRSGRPRKVSHVTEDGVRQLQVARRMLERLWHGLVLQDAGHDE